MECFSFGKGEEMTKITHASLFSGIGGFDLAAEIVGFKNLFTCEKDEFCNKILKYYWPNIEHYGDIKTTDFTIWRGKIDILTGGFPCQPFSLAGKRKGTEDDRHLWPEMLRAISEIQPGFIIGENVYGIVNWDGDLYSTRCNLTWKLKVTKSYRLYFQLAPSTLHTGEIECGLLLPTPTSIQRDHEYRVKSLKDMGAKSMMSRLNGEQRPNSILDHINFYGLIPTIQTQGIKQCIKGKSYPIKNSLLPTPLARDWAGPCHETQSCLPNHLKKGLLPTPRANKVNGCDLNSENFANRNKGNLEEIIAKWVTGMLPTPTADDNPAKNTGKRNQDSLQKRAFQTTGENFPTQSPICCGDDGISSQLDLIPFLKESLSQESQSPFLNGETNQ